MRAYEEVIKLNSKIRILQNKINTKKVKAVKELREMDYSLDIISRILSMGKINVLNIIKGKKKKMFNKGRKKIDEIFGSAK